MNNGHGLNTTVCLLGHLNTLSYFSVYGIGGIIHCQHDEEYLPSRPSFYMVRTLSKFMVITLQI